MQILLHALYTMPCTYIDRMRNVRFPLIQIPRKIGYFVVTIVKDNEFHGKSDDNQSKMHTCCYEPLILNEVAIFSDQLNATLIDSTMPRLSYMFSLIILAFGNSLPHRSFRKFSFTSLFRSASYPFWCFYVLERFLWRWPFHLVWFCAVETFMHLSIENRNTFKCNIQRLTECQSCRSKQCAGILNSNAFHEVRSRYGAQYLES